MHMHDTTRYVQHNYTTNHFSFMSRSIRRKLRLSSWVSGGGGCCVLPAVAAACQSSSSLPVSSTAAGVVGCPIVSSIISGAADRLMSARTNKLVASTTIDLVLAVLMEDGRHGIYVYMSPVEKSSVGSTFYKLFLLTLLYSNRQTVEIIFTVNFLCEPPVKNVSCIYSGCASRKFSKSLVPILFNRRRQAAQILHDYSLSSPPAIDPSPSSVFMT
jgi:hypothetical protein